MAVEDILGRTRQLQHQRLSKGCDLPAHIKIASDDTVNPATTARDALDARDATSVRHRAAAIEPELNTSPAARATAASS